MRNYDKISNLLDEFKNFSVLNDETVIERLLKLSNTAGRISKYSNEFKSFTERFTKLNIEIDDLFISINNYINNLSFDQNNFENTQSRLYKINELEKKHNVTSISDLITKKNELKKLLDNSEYHSEKINAITNQLDILKSKMLEIAKKISSSRKLSSNKIQNEMEVVFKKLALKNSKIEFNLTETNDFNSNGINDIEVLYKPNKQSKSNILSKIASGGEKSRILFAIKSILAKKIDLPTLVFDEIDSHLPQVASLAENHFKVFKTESEKNIIINIKKLDKSTRIEEIASMISGENITESAISQAHELLK
jgi:DNA repair protein RecN (Recombination protein N)